MTFTLSPLPQRHANHSQGGHHNDVSTSNDSDLISDRGLIHQGNVDYIEYVGFLDDGDFDVWIDPTLPKHVKKFTKRLIRMMDRVTGTEISRTKDESEADIFVHDVENYDNWSEEYQDSAGLQYWNNGKAHATWLDQFNEEPHVTINKRGKKQPSDFTKYLITHEVLHAFGLSHPFDDGRHPSYDTYDTAMSYNINGDSFVPLRPADITALQQIWG